MKIVETNETIARLNPRSKVEFFTNKFVFLIEPREAIRLIPPVEGWIKTIATNKNAIAIEIRRYKDIIIFVSYTSSLCMPKPCTRQFVVF